ncbi:Hypothetical predicted protein [Olea europaea subsp. europaea]|uniref:Uncharacterized protein n=1 Tax=Olea europaea subsp. europaea TaxID=158383 RepID=A0A8S0UCI3_OLEEU|nr:Hypothetical predicted protein [Olea europaea subsp. europaea]
MTLEGRAILEIIPTDEVQHIKVLGMGMTGYGVCLGTILLVDRNSAQFLILKYLLPAFTLQSMDETQKVVVALIYPMSAINRNLKGVELQHEGATKEEMLKVFVSSPLEDSEPVTPSPNKKKKVKMTTNKWGEKYCYGLIIRAEIHMAKHVGIVLKMAQQVDYKVLPNQALGEMGPNKEKEDGPIQSLPKFSVAIQ